MPLLDHLAELGERLEAQRFGKLVVHGHRLRRLDRLHGDVELGLFAGQMGGRIGLRERHLDGRLLAGANADELLLEARDEVPEPRWSETSPPVPPWNGVPSILPVKSMMTRSPFSALAPSPFGANGRLCSAILASAFVDFGVGDLGVHALELDALEVGQLDRRQDLDRDRVGKIALALDHLLDRALFLRQLTFGSRTSLKPCSVTIWALASRTAVSIISAITARP